MADRYIDYWEVGEYGGYFVRAARTLVGASPLVDMAEVSALVADAVARMDSELARCGMKRSSLRLGRGDTAAAVAAARTGMRRFFQYLGSIDTTGVDVEAFFPGHRLGNVSKLKPADLKSRLDEIVNAFAVPASSGLPERSAWQSTLTAARDALGGALSSKGGAEYQSRRNSTGLRQARENFLHVYNRVAKPITFGLLQALGREHELKLYFVDLQVNETGRPARAAATHADMPADMPATDLA